MSRKSKASATDWTKKIFNGRACVVYVYGERECMMTRVVVMAAPSEVLRGVNE
jgi:hypothetical protein